MDYYKYALTIFIKEHRILTGMVWFNRIGMVWSNRKSSKPKPYSKEKPLDLPSICGVGKPLGKKEFPLYTPAEVKGLQEQTKSFLETLTKEEIHTLKDAMITARTNYLTAIGIIANGQRTNPSYMVIQQGMLGDVLRGYVHGSGLGYIGAGLQMTPEKMREFLKPLGFTEEEFPYHNKD